MNTVLDLLLLWVAAYATLYLLVLTHELGHTIAAWLLGLHTHELIIGHGIGIIFPLPKGFSLQIGALPLGGSVDPFRDYKVRTNWDSLRVFLVAISGPFMGFSMGLLLLLWFSPGSALEAFLWCLFGLAGPVLNITALMPNKDTMNDGYVASVAWRAFSSKNPTYLQRHFADVEKLLSSNPE